jgi:hypothetical protein
MVTNRSLNKPTFAKRSLSERSLTKRSLSIVTTIGYTTIQVSAQL